MNWTRGLFRLWILFSALWIVAVAVLALSQISLTKDVYRKADAEEIRKCIEREGLGLAWCEKYGGINDLKLRQTKKTTPELIYSAGPYIINALGVPVVMLLFCRWVFFPIGRWIVFGFREDRVDR